MRLVRNLAQVILISAGKEKMEKELWKKLWLTYKKRKMQIQGMQNLD